MNEFKKKSNKYFFFFFFVFVFDRVRTCDLMAFI